MKRDLDFHHVRAEHVEIHERLLNWAKWCGAGVHAVSVLPMFRHYRHGYEEPRAGSGVDSLDGQAVEKVVTSLPEKHRTALQWAYVKPWIPVLAVRRVLGLKHQALYDVLQEARCMVANRLKRRGLTRLSVKCQILLTDEESGLERSL